MSKTAAELAEQAIASGKLEEEQKPNTAEEQPKDAPAKEEPKKDEKPKDDTKGKADTDESAAGDKVDEEEPEGEFTADDALEVDDEPAKTPDVPTDNQGVVLTPAEQKYVVDNIGDPLTLTGMRGDKEVTIKAFLPSQIPADFKFKSDADRLTAQEGFSRLERKADQLLGTYRNNQSQELARDFERRENEAIRADVADLQKAGDFPKFKVQPGQEGFDDDPAAQQMTEVLQLMANRNEQYLKEYQQGRSYRHIGFREAFEIWQRQQPAKAKEDAAAKEDADRGKVAGKVGGNGSQAGGEGPARPRVRSGMTVEDILRRHEMEEW